MYLKSMLEGLSPEETHGMQPESVQSNVPSQPRRGKVPPVDTFTGENPEILLDDWIPSRQKASDWNA